MVSEEKVVFVGGKPFMNYVTAVVMQFSTNGADNVIIRSRGKFISRAVDVAEMVRSKFLTDSIEIGKVNIAAEDFKNKEGRPIRVSTIDIHLNKLNGVTPTSKNFELRRPKTKEKEEQKPEETVAEPEVKEEPKVEEKVETPVEETVTEEPAIEETTAEEIVSEPEIKEEDPKEEAPTEQPAVEEASEEKAEEAPATEAPTKTEQTNLTPSETSE